MGSFFSPCLLILFVVFGGICAFNINQEDDFRIPTFIHPTEYYLRLLVVLDPLAGYERFTVAGDATINVTCMETTSKVYLQAANLTIDYESVKIRSESTGSELDILSFANETLNDFFIISLRDPLQPGEVYILYIQYTAPIPDYRLQGMYQDYYIVPETEEKRYLATTLFAPYHARRLYPSFDEPAFRAEYRVEIGHHEKYHAMANEDVILSRPVDGIPDYIWTIFKTTPSISSYISAMIVSDFTYEEGDSNDRTFRVYAAPHLIEKGAGKYTVELSEAVLRFYENRFQFMYPLQKLYSVALPQFFFSAMENIGLITYKEPQILYLKNETTEEERYRIHYVVGHEIGHQWFGNVVAVDWWAYIWLKEGYATFYSHYAINHTNPEMKPWEMFIPSILAVAMNFDATNATRPLEHFPPTSANVQNIYGAIPYQKGASIIRMTSTFMTESVFEEAMKLYIETFQYSSADQNDLFDILQDTVDEYPLIQKFIPAPIRDIMNSWCQQTRFPIVEVSQTNESYIQLTQKAFNDDGLLDPSKTWWVPINLQPRSRPDLPDTVPDTWIPQGAPSTAIEVTAGETVIVNPDATGYYIVFYAAKLRADILALLETSHLSIPATGRSKLLFDTFHLVFSGYLSLGSAMDFTKYIHNDMSIASWKMFQEVMKNLQNFITRNGDEDAITLLKEYLNSKLTTAWNALHKHNKEAEMLGDRGILRDLLAKWSCGLGRCLDLSVETITNFALNPETVDVSKDQQYSLYCSAASIDSEGYVFEYILNDYANPRTLFGRKQRLLESLACTKDEQALKRLVDEIFKRQTGYFGLDSSYQLLQLLSKEPAASKLLLEVLTRNPIEFIERFAENTVDAFIFNVADNLSSSQSTALLDAFRAFDKVQVDKISARLAQSKRQQAMADSTNLKKWLLENM